MKKNFLAFAALILFCTNLFAQEKEVTFNAKYIKQNDNKTTVEINEVQELTYIIFSLTEMGKNPNMVNQTTAYYKEVQTYFAPHTGHKTVLKFNELLNESIINYFIIAANAYGFTFEGDKIVPTGVYDFPAKGIGKFEVKENPVVTYLGMLEEFAKTSGYRKFYKNHTAYYDTLKKEYYNYAAIDKQKAWLESRFDYKINSYRVLTSPLIGGMNATHTFEDNGFKETLLFLPTIKNDAEWSENYRKALNTRIIFTEIDHNYVGQVSAENKDAIDAIFNNRAIWVDGTNKGAEHYPNPVKVYDEYLTWGLFLLYAHDNFSGDAKAYADITENVNSMMIKKGFPKGKEFNDYLLQLYKNSKDKKIAALYPALLEWSRGVGK